MEWPIVKSTEMNRKTWPLTAIYIYKDATIEKPATAVTETPSVNTETQSDEQGRTENPQVTQTTTISQTSQRTQSSEKTTSTSQSSKISSQSSTSTTQSSKGSSQSSTSSSSSAYPSSSADSQNTTSTQSMQSVWDSFIQPSLPLSVNKCTPQSTNPLVNNAQKQSSSLETEELQFSQELFSDVESIYDDDDSMDIDPTTTEKDSPRNAFSDKQCEHFLDMVKSQRIVFKKAQEYTTDINGLLFSLLRYRKAHKHPQAKDKSLKRVISKIKNN